MTSLNGLFVNNAFSNGFFAYSAEAFSDLFQVSGFTNSSTLDFAVFKVQILDVETVRDKRRDGHEEH